jgi:hypothetical protein
MFSTPQGSKFKAYTKIFLCLLSYIWMSGVSEYMLMKKATYEFKPIREAKKRLTQNL